MASKAPAKLFLQLKRVLVRAGVPNGVIHGVKVAVSVEKVPVLVGRDGRVHFHKPRGSLGWAGAFVGLCFADCWVGEQGTVTGDKAELSITDRA